MIAKIVASGDDRDAAMAALEDALANVRIWPVKTNAAFLIACLRAPEFRAGDVTTGFIADQGDTLTAPPQPQDSDWKVAGVQMFAPHYFHRDDKAADPWRKALGFRLNAPERGAITVQHGEERRAIDLMSFEGADGYVQPVADGLLTFRDGRPLLFTKPKFTSGDSGSGAGTILAPMPGRITSVDVATGDAVIKGQKLLTLEAMKMEHALTAPFDGEVAELHATAGGQVQVDALLARVEANA